MPPEPRAALDRATIAAQVIAWQREHGRHDLPWQGTRDAYRVWLSEVMLQQTQVATVRSYYERFLQRFPSVQTIAEAQLDEVLAQWSGLGYYSRARLLHRCAQQVVAAYGGHFPSTAAELQTLPGIGRSTAAAIAALCHGERVAILDGNVKRVLARVLAFDADLADARAMSQLWREAEALLPPRDVATYTQGLMDLGATVCLARAPRCDACPLRARCTARREGQPARYPVKSRRLRRSQWMHWLLWVEHRGRWWLQRRADRGVWGGLWCLPMLDDEARMRAIADGARAELTRLADVRHVLTHADWLLLPHRCRLPTRLASRRLATIESALGPGGWFTPAEAFALGLPAPVRKLLGEDA